MLDPVIDPVLLKEAEKNRELARIKRENPDTGVEVKKEISIVDLITLDHDEVKNMNNREIEECAIGLSKPASKAKKTAVKVKIQLHKMKFSKCCL